MEKLKMINDLIKEYEVKTGINFTGNLKLNGRLSKSLGRCVSITRRNGYTGEVISTTPKAIEISKKFLDVASEEEVRKVVAHEYAHYCTIVKVGRHNHDTKEFKDYCNLLNTSHKATTKLQNRIKRKYDVYCSCCHKILASSNTSRADVVKYAECISSHCCDAPLKVIKNY